MTVVYLEPISLCMKVKVHGHGVNICSRFT